MKIRLLKDCKNKPPKNQRLLGLDLGVKTIGLAISNSEQTLATPLQTIKRTKFMMDIKLIGEVVREYEIGGYIIGLPLNMDGSQGARCDATRSFADEMTKYPDIIGENPFIAYQDERLSTQAVDDVLDKRVDMKQSSKRGAKKSGLTDKLAAQVILQSALDSL